MKEQIRNDLRTALRDWIGSITTTVAEYEFDEITIGWVCTRGVENEYDFVVCWVMPNEMAISHDVASGTANDVFRALGRRIN